jgi:dCTP deaminase
MEANVMILTGSEICVELVKGSLDIRPFCKSRLNPNSYNFRLGSKLYHIVSDADGNHFSKTLEMTDGRWLLEKGEFYLGTTLEVMGSDHFVTTLVGRSSIARLGLFVQVSADLGHQGSTHCWTLELKPMHSCYVYPGQPIGQVSFWMVQGKPRLYSGEYGLCDTALMSSFSDGRACNDFDRA